MVSEETVVTVLPSGCHSNAWHRWEFVCRILTRVLCSGQLYDGVPM